MVDRISGSDEGYTSGDLSVYPLAVDTKEVLYEAKNNAVTLLKQTLSYNAKIVIVDDTSKFADKGIIRVGPLTGSPSSPELIYYDKKTGNTFQNLKRGFAGSRQNRWVPDGKTIVTNSVNADMHNTIKDAIINIENNLGVKEDPEPLSLNGILKAQETRFLLPKPLFRAFPIKGKPPLKVRFQNFTTGHVVRHLWDFGDGGTSLEKSPIHTYVNEGIFTVKLNVITSTQGQGIVTKKNYIVVSNDTAPPFFYVESISNPYSSQTASQRTSEGTPTSPKEFIFVDQTDGDIVQRNWIYGDGNQYTENDPDIHVTSHIYSKPGSYDVTLLVVFSNGRVNSITLSDPLSVL